MAEWSLEHLLQTDPHDFENLIAYLFGQMGYKAEVTQQSRDGGVDIELRMEHFGLSHRWLLQAKRYTGAVGVKEVREYSSLRYRDNVDGVIIVTTAGFTREGEKEAAKHNVKLIGGALLIEMLNHYCPDAQVSAADMVAITNAGTPADAKRYTLNGAILKNGEKVLASEPVMVGKHRVTMVLTNRNIFFKNDTGGILSRKSEICRRIAINDIIGVHAEPKQLFLVTGPKEVSILRIQAKNRDRILATLERMRTDYLRGEHLLRFSRRGAQFLVLTNKRLLMVNLRDKLTEELMIKNIIGSDVTGAGLFKTPKLIVSESSNGIRKHEIEVDDARAWLMAIEEAVRGV